jgi:hypothetical protein
LVSPTGECLKVGLVVSIVDALPAQPGHPGDELCECGRGGHVTAAESVDGASWESAGFDDRCVWEHPQCGQDELRVDAPTAVIVGRGNLVGSLEAGGKVFEVVCFLANVADGEIAHRPSTEESSGFAAAGPAIGTEALGFAFSAIPPLSPTKQRDATSRPRSPPRNPRRIALGLCKRDQVDALRRRSNGKMGEGATSSELGSPVLRFRPSYSAV